MVESVHATVTGGSGGSDNGKQSTAVFVSRSSSVGVAVVGSGSLTTLAVSTTAVAATGNVGSAPLRGIRMVLGAVLLEVVLGVELEAVMELQLRRLLRRLSRRLVQWSWRAGHLL